MVGRSSERPCAGGAATSVDAVSMVVAAVSVATFESAEPVSVDAVSLAVASVDEATAVAVVSVDVVADVVETMLVIGARSAGAVVVVAVAGGGGGGAGVGATGVGAGAGLLAATAAGLRGGVVDRFVVVRAFGFVAVARGFAAGGGGALRAGCVVTRTPIAFNRSAASRAMKSRDSAAG